MALIVLPILSLVLYLIGFFSSSLVLYMAVAGLGVAIFSYRRSVRVDVHDPISNFSKYSSMVLIVIGVVFLLSSLLSIFVLGPVLSSII